MRLIAIATLTAASLAALGTGLPAAAPGALPEAAPTPTPSPKPTAKPKPSGGTGHVKAFDGNDGGPLSVTVSTATPVAAPADWYAAAAAFRAGRTSGTSPQTTGEYATCAGWWSSWAKALKARPLTFSQLKPLPAEAKLPKAQMIADAWIAWIRPKGVEPRDLAEAQTTASAVIDRAIAGDSKAAAQALEWLGLCPMPK